MLVLGAAVWTRNSVAVVAEEVEALVRQQKRLVTAVTLQHNKTENTIHYMGLTLVNK